MSAIIDPVHAGAEAYGTYHVGCQGDASWLELGNASLPKRDNLKICW